MSNALQPSGRQTFLQGDADWLVDTFKIVLVDASYIYSAAHDFLADVGAGARIATTAALGSKTATNGYAFSASPVLSAVPAGDTAMGFWLYRDTGVEATSHLVAFYDTKSDDTPISLATNGGNVTINPAALGWFRL